MSKELDILEEFIKRKFKEKKNFFFLNILDIDILF